MSVMKLRSRLPTGTSEVEEAPTSPAHRLATEVAICEKLANDVLRVMHKGVVKELCENDPTMIFYGNLLCGTGQSNEPDHGKKVRATLRIVARVAVRAMTIDPSLLHVNDMFRPSAYMTFERAVREICGDGEGRRRRIFRAPTGPTQYGPKFRDLVVTILGQLENLKVTGVPPEEEPALEERIQSAKEWLKRYNHHFDKKIASKGRRQAKARAAARNGAPPHREADGSEDSSDFTGEDSDDLPHSRSYQSRRRTPKVKWTELEIQALMTHFGPDVFDHQPKLPSLGECHAAIEAFPCLNTRNPPQVKTYISNRRKAAT